MSTFTSFFFFFVCVKNYFEKKTIPKMYMFTCSFFQFCMCRKVFRQTDTQNTHIHLFLFQFLCVIKCFKNWYLKYRHSLVHFSILYIKRVLQKPVSELFMFASSILYLFISLVCSFIFFQNNVFTTVLEATTLPCTSVVYTDNVESRLKTLCLYNYICEDTRLFSS